MKTNNVSTVYHRRREVDVTLSCRHNFDFMNSLGAVTSVERENEVRDRSVVPGKEDKILIMQ